MATKTIIELNKQREVQKELIVKKRMLAENIDIARKEWDDVNDRLQDVNEIIITLRGKLK